jgi:hypothetical protein
MTPAKFTGFRYNYSMAEAMAQANVEDAWRVRLALGPEPLENVSYLLPPLLIPPSLPPLPEGPHDPTEFVLDITGERPLLAGAVRSAFAVDKRVGMGLSHLWATRRGREGQWRSLNEFPDDSSLVALTMTWELTGIFTEGVEAIAELSGYILRARALANSVGWNVIPRETPVAASTRAARLTVLKVRFAQSIEMRLSPQGRAFPDRSIWRALYGIGLVWGSGDLFHWFGGADVPLFSVSGLGHPTRFLPERAAEGEGSTGLSLAFELPVSPSPLEVYDRMSVALSYLRQKLGGQPLASDGSELDANRLFDDRDTLSDAIQEMARVGIAPNSPDARRLF